MDTPFDLTGKIAIVTGAARGLGFAIADALATAGARVMMSDAAGDAGQAACDGLAERGLDLGFERCDVTRAEELYALVARTVRAFGGLDILVANAGISDRMKGSSSGDMDDYARVLDVNLTSAVRLCALAVPHLKARGGGSIILMASLAGLRGNSRLGPYALSKAALAQFARNLAVEHGPSNIRANAIAPGFIRTDLAAALLADEAFMARRMAMTPLRRPGEPHEVAGAALFLASRAGAFVTGQTIVVDGGTLITDGS